MLIFVLAFLIAITVHEAAHAFVADKLGDPTARLLKRLTLNPIAHIDPYGTLLIPFILYFLRFPFIFGWAKPVPIDSYNLANPKRDSALISLAGPTANITLATILAIFLRFLPVGQIVSVSLETIITINVVLAIFNLIPIHPLDGEKILIGIMPPKEGRELDIFLTRYGTLILLFLIFPLFGGSSIIFQIISPIINLVRNLLLPFHTI